MAILLFSTMINCTPKLVLLMAVIALVLAVVNNAALMHWHSLLHTTTLSMDAVMPPSPSPSLHRKDIPQTLSNLKANVQDISRRLGAPPTNVSRLLFDTHKATGFGLLAAPMTWTCASPQQQDNKKLVFVHIFKTAGSSFRAALDDYAATCAKGITVVMRCSGVTLESLQQSSSNWASRDGQRCVNEFSRQRHKGAKKFNVYGPLTSRFVRDTADILIGHLPIGIHQGNWWWNTTATNNNDNSSSGTVVVEPQYVAFFRNPVTKYVSGRIYLNPRWTFDDAVTQIKAQVRAEREKGAYYFGSEKYLTTPQQRAAKMHHRSLPKRLEMMQRNLLRFDCLVGVVEQMGDSLALLQYVMDGNTNQQLAPAFRRLDTTTSTAQSSFPNKNHKLKSEPLTVVNKSHLSTTALVQALQQDDKFYDVLLEYLKYEFWLYDFALQIHERQVQQLQEYQRSSSSP